jgi:Winged helix-turn helix
MSGVTKIEIKEKPETLKSLMRRQKTSLGFAKVQALYLLRINAVDTIEYLAVILGRSEITVHRWLKLYRIGGLAGLLEEKKPPGRPPKNHREPTVESEKKTPDFPALSSYTKTEVCLG